MKREMKRQKTCTLELFLLYFFLLLIGDNLTFAQLGHCSSSDGSEVDAHLMTKPPVVCNGCPNTMDRIEVRENQFKINDSVIEFHGVKDISIEPSPPPSGFVRVLHNSKFNWSIVLTKNIDREDTQFDFLNSFQDKISCSPKNGGGGIPYIVTFQVDNKIETGPQFRFTEFDITIPEDTKTDHVLQTITPFFNETTEVSLDFALKPVGNQDNLVLRLSSQRRSVDLTLLKMLDYDKGVTTYNMTLTAKVFGAPKFSTTTSIFVHVTDVDDQNPTFTKDVYRCSIPEMAVLSEVITCDSVPIAYDQDKGLNETIAYEIVGIADSTFIPFTIDTNDGRILVNGTVDREKKDFYAFTIMAKQIDKPLLRRATSLVYVQVQDANDNSPVMSSATYDISIPENLPDRTFVLKVAATDSDKGNNSLFGFRLYGDYAPFEIDEKSGVISVKNSALLDREIYPSFKFEVQAIETATKERHTSNRSPVMITLLDENDNSPEFNSSNKQLFVVNKTISVGTTIRQMTAFDEDAGDLGKITYSLSGFGDSITKFTIDPKTGDIKVAAPLVNYPTIDFGKSSTDMAIELENNFTRRYRFDVIASDSDKKERRQTAIPIEIRVLDENVNAPFVFYPQTNSKYPTRISENFPIKRMVFDVEVLDLDLDDIPSLYITVDPLPFAISKNVIYLKNPLDRETQSHYDLHVTVSDGIHKKTTTYRVEVVDENDNAPQFTKQIYNFSITEEMENVLVGVVNATDKDEGNNAEFDYRILPSLWSSNFTVFANGTISTISKIDRESLNNSKITLLVEAVDHGVPSLTGTTVVNIEVKDINDNAPVFQDDDGGIYVIDELSVKGNFCRVKAVDADQDHVLYTLTKNPHQAFQIDQDGFISLVIPIELGLTKSFSLTLTVSAGNTMPYIDSNLKNAERNITVLVKDINNRGPVFSKSSYDYLVAEGTAGTLPGDCIKAIDRDVNLENTIITYRIVSGDVDHHLYIDSHTGCIQIVRPFDYEQTTHYSVLIGASDPKPWYNNETAIHNVTARANIIIEDVNDQKPNCISSQITMGNESSQAFLNFLPFSSKENPLLSKVLAGLLDNFKMNG